VKYLWKLLGHIETLRERKEAGEALVTEVGRFGKMPAPKFPTPVRTERKEHRTWVVVGIL